ncbi:heparinase II/III family protein [Shewanella algae]|uniref:heparinase II/III family protein n=1 Tax=Shewanella algae TaxID=38313 RepID=UPI0031F4FFBC
MINLFSSIYKRLVLETHRLILYIQWKYFPCNFDIQISKYELDVVFFRTLPPIPRIIGVNEKARCYRRGALFILSNQNIDLDSPIDWHYDEHSKFRWEKGRWYKSYKIPPKLGIDVKRVWEKSRFNFLPTLALDFANIESEETFHSILTYLKSYNESNPPFSGVNWFYSMDVGIRMFNCVLSGRIIKGIDQDCKDIEAEIKTNISTGYFHIINNLENYRGRTNNHYLCNLLGIASFLSVVNGREKYKSKAVELIESFNSEVQKQINKDGSSFEGSFYYHRLSLECFLYTYILITEIQSHFNINESVLPKTKLLISKMIDFYINVQFRGRLPAIGDNDSGVIFSLGLCHKKPNTEDRRVLPELDTLISLILGSDSSNGLVECSYKKLFKSIFPVFFSMNRIECAENALLNKESCEETYGCHVGRLYFSDCTIEIGSQENVKVRNYPCFGVVVIEFAEQKAYLKYSNLNGCHSHNDLFNFSILSQDFDIDDNGTYEYSSFPKFNALNKSYISHNGPKDKCGILVDYIDGNELFANMFIGNNFVKACIEIKGVFIQREIKWSDNTLKVIDSSSLPLLDIVLDNKCFYQYGFLIDCGV